LKAQTEPDEVTEV